MTRSISRVGRRSLALATAIAALTTLVACADDQPLTAPAINAPRAAADVVPAVVGDSTHLAITIDRNSRFYSDGNGAAVVTGTLTCSRVAHEEIVLGVRVQQKQPGNVVGDGSGERWFTCLTPGVQSWFAYVPAASGYFDLGKANVSLRLIERSSGIVPTSPSARVTLYE